MSERLNEDDRTADCDDDYTVAWRTCFSNPNSNFKPDSSFRYAQLRCVQAGWKRLTGGLLVFALMIGMVIHLFADEPEIALLLGEPWEDMRERSSAAIPPAIPGHHWFRIPQTNARLRFVDPQYGFVTPLALYLTVGFDNKQRVGSIRMSPQIEPLLLDDTLKVVLDLQGQWRKAGWTPVRDESHPPFADTPEWRAQLRDVNRGGSTYWRANNQYQVMLVVGRFRDDSRPTEERYLITLQLATPWGHP